MNPTNRKALVIGINRYPELNDGHLKVSADDAEAIAQLLGTYGHFHPIYRFPRSVLLVCYSLVLLGRYRGS